MNSKAWTYCHATTLNITTGDTITAGQEIALSGNTGNSTGPHLHLQIKDPAGVLTCPQPLLAAIYSNQPPPPLPTSSCIEPETADYRLALTPPNTPVSGSPHVGPGGQPTGTSAPSNPRSTLATSATGPTTTNRRPDDQGQPVRPARKPIERLEPAISTAAHPPGASTPDANIASQPFPTSSLPSSTPTPTSSPLPSKTTDTSPAGGQ